ncbi:MAG: Ig-like domain-containing protein, partial [Fidelibacterota bacterium]
MKPQLPPTMSRLPLRLILLHTATLAVFWKCAAEKPPTGGLPDTEGPRIIQVNPPSGTADLDPSQGIEITFNEQVDPVSVPGSVVIAPEVSFTTRVRGRRILIRPEEPYQPDRAY